MTTYARFVTTATHTTQNTRPNALRFHGNTSVRLPFLVLNYAICRARPMWPRILVTQPVLAAARWVGGLINRDYETLWRILPLIHKISLYHSELDQDKVPKNKLLFRHRNFHMIHYATCNTGLEKRAVGHVPNKFSTFYGTRRSIRQVRWNCP
jgi:hypothetical protein